MDCIWHPHIIILLDSLVFNYFPNSLLIRITIKDMENDCRLTVLTNQEFCWKLCKSWQILTSLLPRLTSPLMVDGSWMVCISLDWFSSIGIPVLLLGLCLLDLNCEHTRIWLLSMPKLWIGQTQRNGEKTPCVASLG